MTVQEVITTLLEQFPHDARSAQCTMAYATNGERQVDAICGVGVMPVGDSFITILIGESEIERNRQKTGTLPEKGEYLKA